jgi:hypothetical protein
MKLIPNLEAHFVKHLPAGWAAADGEIYRSGGLHWVDTLGEADGLWFLCPKCFAANGGRPGTHAVICWLVGKVQDDVRPGPGRWTPTGSGLDDLTFVPSEGRSHSVALTGGCAWHGFVTNGDAA